MEVAIVVFIALVTVVAVDALARLDEHPCTRGDADEAVTSTGKIVVDLSGRGDDE